jgi:hypothetical protein
MGDVSGTSSERGEPGLVSGLTGACAGEAASPMSEAAGTQPLTLAKGKSKQTNIPSRHLNAKLTKTLLSLYRSLITGKFILTFMC